MFTRDNLWFGLRGHWWSFENQPSLFSSLGKYLGWFLIMSLWSQKPKDFGVKNWYFAGSETPQCIRLSCQSFHRFTLCTFGRFEFLEIESWKLYYSVFYSTFFSPRKNGKGSQTSGGWDVLSCFNWTWTVFPWVPKPFSGYYWISRSSLWMVQPSTPLPETTILPLQNGGLEDDRISFCGFGLFSGADSQFHAVQSGVSTSYK